MAEPRGTWVGGAVVYADLSVLPAAIVHQLRTGTDKGNPTV